MGQRIASSASAYLRQHAHQPVDWWPYGDEAFAEAASRDIPVFLSIGYAACHWCHVMARESFDDPTLAAYLNEHFVPIKVDREEHPAVDAAYMSATQTLSGSGGWPMSVFTLPDGRAMHAGTYFPPVPRPGLPSFGQVLEAVNDAWINRRQALELQATTLAEHLGSVADGQAKLFSRALPLPTGSNGAVLAPVLGTAVRKLAELADPTGGFSPAPKFPPSAVLDFLLRAGLGPGSVATLATSLASQTLAVMATSSLADHVGGGFARYCVDARWKIPHFEKMLYDNAQLLGIYARAAIQLPDPDTAKLCRVAAQGIHRWLRQEMLLPSGGLASSLDADTVMPDGSHQEGGTYTFSRAEVDAILGGSRGGGFRQLWEGAALPAVGSATVADSAEDVQLTIALARVPELGQWPLLAADFEKLAAQRSGRAQPGRDEKVVAGWNGLAVAALAEASVLLGEPAMAETAGEVAEYLYRVHWEVGAAGGGPRLHRISHRGDANTSITAVLEDHAAVALGFGQLGVATGDSAWFERADQVLSVALENFLSAGAPRDNAGTDPRVLATRGGAHSAEALDDAVPSATSLLASALLDRAGRRQLAESLWPQGSADLGDEPTTTEGGGTAASMESSEADLALVRMLLGFVPPLAPKAPSAIGSALGVAARFVHGSSTELVVSGGTDEQRVAAVRLGMLAGVAQLGNSGGQPLEDVYPAGPKGQLRIYVCRGGVCHAPVSDLASLAALIVPGVSRELLGH